MAQKRILFFLPLPPPVHGAALRNKSLVESQRLNKYFEIAVLPFNFAEGTEDIGKMSLRKFYKFFQRAFQLIDKLVRFKPHVLYFNISLYGFALYRDFIYAMLIKCFRVKLVFHLRTQGVKKQTEQSVLKRWMFRSIFRNTSVICLSEFLATDIADVYAQTPFVVNNGVEDVSMKYIPAPAENDTPRLLFLSNFAVNKGVLDLLQALHMLKQRGTEFKAMLVGSAADLTPQQLQDKVTALGLQKYVNVAGPRYGDEKFNAIISSDIFVLPTHFEAFPGVILEAMQFGLPVVASREGAIPEIVDEGITGLISEKHRPDDLAGKLEMLLKDRTLRKKLGEAGRAKFRTSYTLTQFEINMVDVFHKITD